MKQDFLNFIRSYTEEHLPLKNKLYLDKFQRDWYSLFLEVLLHPLQEELIFKNIQCFSLPIKISESLEADIQIDIEALLEQIEVEIKVTSEIPLKYFIENKFQNRELLLRNRSLIGYALDEPFNSVSNNPIIICVPNFQFINFVLDGNHRVEYALRNHQNNIKGY